MLPKIKTTEPDFDDYEKFFIKDRKKERDHLKLNMITVRLGKNSSL